MSDERLVKFRAWHRELQVYFDPEALWFNKNGDIWLNNSHEFFEDRHRNKLYGYVGKHIDLEQYIGTVDKYGKQICEGDILRTNEASWLAKVVYIPCMFMLQDSRGGFSAEPEWEKCEIIGNIRQNPELMK